MALEERPSIHKKKKREQVYILFSIKTNHN